MAILDHSQRKVLKCTIVIVAIVSVVIALVSGSWAKGALAFGLILVALLLSGWPLPSAPKGQDHMLRNPWRKD